MTDAAHMLSDVAGFLVSVLALILSGREANAEYSFGYHRAEVLGAVASIFVVWLMTGILVWEAITRLITPEVVDGKVMFIVSSLGIVMNLVLMRVFGHNHSHGGLGDEHADHGHSHGHDHEHGHAPLKSYEPPVPLSSSTAGGSSAAHAHDHGHHEQQHGHAEHSHGGHIQVHPLFFDPTLFSCHWRQLNESRRQEGCCGHDHDDHDHDLDDHAHGHDDHAHGHDVRLSNALD
uniref:Cation efflux protein transmembrane domain-containing protein n=1 Tax=Haptolina ericina TaxID=156174 RepID=A0A7S3AW17_9EUKA